MTKQFKKLTANIERMNIAVLNMNNYLMNLNKNNQRQFENVAKHVINVNNKVYNVQIGRLHYFIRYIKILKDKVRLTRLLINKQEESSRFDRTR